jgi:glutamyl-tRNA reductase
MELSLIGISHRTAPVDVRERFSLSGDQVRQFLRTTHAENVFEEALVLSTCNRTDVFFVSAGPRDGLGYFIDQVRKIKGLTGPMDASAFYRHSGQEAVNHLFHVAASLDSQIVGEHQILGQIKEAYRLAAEERTSRFLLNKLLHWSFRVGKRVQTETPLGRGSASIAQAAVELAQRVFSDLQGKSVLFIGAGQTAQLAARAVIRGGVRRVIVANRTLANAQQAADDLLRQLPQAADAAEEEDAEFPREITCPALLQMYPELKAQPAAAPTADPRTQLDIRAITIEEIPSVIAGVDLLISSTGSPEMVLTRQTVGDILRHSGGPLFIVDIAVPRDVDPALGELTNVFLHNIDDLNLLVARNIDRRRREIPRAEAIVQDEVQRFARWLDSLQLLPTIRLLQKYFETLQKGVIRRYSHQFKADDEQLDRLTQSLCKQLLHKPLTFLNQLPQSASASESLAAIDLIRRMFDLDSLCQNSSDSTEQKT